jgi:hypothetical protein
MNCPRKDSNALPESRPRYHGRRSMLDFIAPRSRGLGSGGRLTCFAAAGRCASRNCHRSLPLNSRSLDAPYIPPTPRARVRSGGLVPFMRDKRTL